MFQLDDSKSLHKKWWFHHFHPLKHGCLGYQVNIHRLQPRKMKLVGSHWRQWRFLYSNLSERGAKWDFLELFKKPDPWMPQISMVKIRRYMLLYPILRPVGFIATLLVLPLDVQVDHSTKICRFHQADYSLSRGILISQNWRLVWWSAWLAWLPGFQYNQEGVSPPFLGWWTTNCCYLHFGHSNQRSTATKNTLKPPPGQHLVDFYRENVAEYAILTLIL